LKEVRIKPPRNFLADISFTLIAFVLGWSGNKVAQHVVEASWKNLHLHRHLLSHNLVQHWFLPTKLMPPESIDLSVLAIP
jgi:hypothetical protein